MYDKKHDQLLIIEAESTGIHVGYCDERGSYWITSEGDSDLLSDCMRGPVSELMVPALFDADECLSRPHADSPFVVWICWCDLVKDSVDVDLLE